MPAWSRQRKGRRDTHTSAGKVVGPVALASTNGYGYMTDDPPRHMVQQTERQAENAGRYSDLMHSTLICHPAQPVRDTLQSRLEQWIPFGLYTALSVLCQHPHIVRACAIDHM